MIKCVSGKKIYLTQEQAEEALVGAHTRFDYAKGHGPINVYQCEDCSYYHLTSKGTVNDVLAKRQKEGKIDRDKEADAWLNKLKRKHS
ncbi:MAG TPA: hypothetical protein PK325_17475 [Cyclobacteriaceae bacterium]|nr:hypothetical protein [Cyclobacteriaceae bacterium]HMV09565.1 hypothetical protein [Cyclobacteriaceae bacterium]HMV90493.1 hypothetical protein [Cyclobacteriaceae bacterium]HMX01972.1 hypothetical protein [Cyclobacteriaceae bacterium]HMX51841.1 hypothetical protein [Cyclobacteriaceae bacterium]